MSIRDAGRTVVVAGATGYVGGHTCLALADAGFRVRGLAREPSRLCREVRAACAEVVAGEATRPATLGGLFDGAWGAVSSIGVRHARRRPTFWDVDRDANLALVDAAERAGVERFAFVSVLRGEQLRGTLRLAAAREQVVDRLRRGPMAATAIRPTGMFNDMGAPFEMAARGRVWLIGDGRTRLNPVHGRDVGDRIAELMRAEQPPEAIDVGGPDVLTQREIGELAFSALGTRARFGRIPGGAVRLAAATARPISANLAEILDGLALIADTSAVAPVGGRHHLADHYAELARARRRRLRREAGRPGEAVR